ncbi:MAG: hypothetical protein AAB818_02070 [Patescibacteria group bacterium]
MEIKTPDILKNNSLKSLVLSLGIKKEQESFLLDKIPQLDEDERIALLKTLTDVYLLNMEEKESAERLKKLWRN